MDYTAFLQTGDEERRLPVISGMKVCDDKSTYRFREAVEPGWYRFQLKGRYLENPEAIEPEFDAWRLKKEIGYVVGGRFFGPHQSGRIHHLPDDYELERYVPVEVASWFDGQLIFVGEQFETEVNLAVREAFEDEASIEAIKGVSPELAQAYMVETTTRALEREREAREREEAAQQERREQIAQHVRSLAERIVFALSHTGARLLDWRQQGRGRAVVRYALGASRYECVIDTESLQIMDSGICLEGADEALSLSSLPSAVQEAIDTGQLHVYRRG